MRAFSTSLLPLNPKRTGDISFAYSGFGANPWRTGFHGACGCDPVAGCHCGSGFSGLAQGTSLDSIIQSAANWLGGYAQSQLPSSAAVPPQYGSTGALMTQLSAWLPYIIVGYVVYRALK
jgi:hypothetical protein